MSDARALWIVGPEEAEYRDVDVKPGPGDLEIETLFTGISRGTERLVFTGGVPESEYDTMRAPFQEGDFPYPVKYGYSAVGRALNTEKAGQLVFALFPHQTSFAVPHDAALPVPGNVPAERAVLAANMETALNITWDAGVGAGDRVVVIGAGVVGALSGYLCARMPGTEVCLVDIDPSREALAKALGCDFALPDKARGNADVVIHASATSEGLAMAIDLAGTEAAIIEASWYGATMTHVPLGGAFHQRRLRIVGSQVGRVPAHRAARWTYARRLAKALQLLADPVLDVLISGETAFDELAENYEAILKDPGTLCHRIRYEAAYS